MRRFYTYILIFVAAAMSLVSCEMGSAEMDDSGEAIMNGLLQLSEEEVVIDGEGGDCTVEVLTPYGYYISTDADWITCAKNDTQSSKSILITAKKNQSVEERTAVITVTLYDREFDVSYSKSLTVRQERGETTLDVYMDNTWMPGEKVNTYEVYDFSGETFNIIVESNDEYTVSSDCDWLTFGKPTADGNKDYITITVKRNDAVNEDPRVGHIIVTAGDKTVKFTVSQVSFTPSLGLSYGYAELEISAVASTKNKIKFTSNSSWKASCDADWITIPVKNKTFANAQYADSFVLEFSAQANTNIPSRSATITIEDNYGNSITTKVEQKSALDLQKNILCAKYMASDYSVNLSASINWEAQSDNDWIEITTASGTAGDVVLIFSVEANRTGAIREGEIVVKSQDNAQLYITLKVEQDHDNAIYYTALYGSISRFTFDVNVSQHTWDQSTKLGRILFDGKITSITSANTNYCTITTMTLPGTIQTIGDKVFCDCKYIESINIPKNTTTIGSEAFGGCVKLKEVLCEPVTPPTLGTSAFREISANCVIYVPMASVEAYKVADGWREYADKIVGYNF